MQCSRRGLAGTALALFLGVWLPNAAGATARIDCAANWTPCLPGDCPQWTKIRFYDDGAYPLDRDERVRWRIIVKAYDINGAQLFLKDSGPQGGASGTPLSGSPNYELVINEASWNGLFDCAHNSQVRKYKIRVAVSGLANNPSPGDHYFESVRDLSPCGGPVSLGPGELPVPASTPAALLALAAAICGFGVYVLLGRRRLAA